MNGWPGWVGDLPTWITTLAIVLAARQFSLERSRRRAEEERESKAQATGLSAWAVTDVDCDPRIYGVVISNTSGSTFHDVRVRCRLHRSEPERPVELDVLPPGEYFVELNETGNRYTWAFAIEVSTYPGHLRPYMKSADYRVTSIEFSDNLTQRWSADEHAVLRRIAASDAA